MIHLLQLAQHNKDLATLLKPTGTDCVGDVALEYYAKHTAQIEVSTCNMISPVCGLNTRQNKCYTWIHRRVTLTYFVMMEQL